MAYTLLLYYGNRLEYYPIDGSRFVIGDSPQSICGFLPGDVSGVLCTLVCAGGAWRIADYRGPVELWRTGDGAYTSITDIDVTNEMVVLNYDRGIQFEIIRSDPEPARTVSLYHQDTVSIGRNAQSDICLAGDGKVSGTHCRLLRRGDVWYIEDLGRNGTWVDGQRMQSHTQTPLFEGQRVQIQEFALQRKEDRLLLYGPAGQIRVNLSEVRKRPKRAKPAAYPYFYRSPRFIEKLPEGEIEIEAAPQEGQKPQINWFSVIVSSFGSMGLMGLVVYFTGRASGSMSMLYTAPMMLMGFVTAVVNYLTQSRKYKRSRALLVSKYDGYLAAKEEEIKSCADAQQRILQDAYPAPGTLIRLAGERGRRLWEKAASDADFLCLRIGENTVPLSVSVKAPRITFSVRENPYADKAAAAAGSHARVDHIPLTVNFAKTPSLGITGQRETVMNITRSLILQAAASYGYDELRIVAVVAAEDLAGWEWMRWLPHMFDESHTKRYFITGRSDAKELSDLLMPEIRAREGKHPDAGKDTPMLPFYLFFLEDMRLLADTELSSYVLRNDPALGIGAVIPAADVGQLPRSTAAVIQTDGTRSFFRYTRQQQVPVEFTPDAVSAKESEAFARALAPVRLPDASGIQSLPATVTFMEGYHIRRPAELDLKDFWENARVEITMSVPIGIRANGDTFYFDINQKAHGPHGLVAGMTGSGKSEMVQSWILSMAVQFSPQDVSFVLIDFKGTGLIAPFRELPHIAGTISDLDKSIDRNLVALRAELQRRKSLFDNCHASGTVRSIEDYLKAYHRGEVTEPLSYLFVIIDEYAEFKANFPDFTAEVNSLFRTGRTLGVYIILLTQNPSGVVTAESESNVRFRWCLKVNSTAASKEVLDGHPEAAMISNPGRAYVRVGTDEIFEPIQSFWSGAPYFLAGRTRREKAAPKIREVALNGDRKGIPEEAAKRGSSGDTEIGAIVRYIHDFTEKRGIRPARQIWMQRLSGRISLTDVLMQFEKKEGELEAAVGMVDDPWEQRQYPLVVPLSGAGHCVIVGAPQTGKTTFLETLIFSLCRTYTAEEVNIYVMDFQSWQLSAFRSFPQVGDVALSNEPERVTKLGQFLDRELAARKGLFSAAGVGSIQGYNSTADRRIPYIVLVIDDFTPVLSSYPELEDFFTRLTREGGSYGMYLVATSGTTSGIGYRLQQNIKQSIALQLTDRTDYVSVVGRTEGIYPENIEGRGLCRLENRVLEFQTALPAGSAGGVQITNFIREEGKRQAAAWKAAPAPRIPIMPERIPYGSVAGPEGMFVLGLEEEKITPVTLDPEKSWRLLVSGESGSGKTNLIRLVARQAAACAGAQILIWGDPAAYGDVAAAGADVTVTNTASKLDAYLVGVSNELRTRQQAKRSGTDAASYPLFILIDGALGCYKEISDESGNRLFSYARNGEGLCVTMVLADDAENWNNYRFNVPLFMEMCKGDILLLGSKPSGHYVFTGKMPAQLKQKEIGEGYGYYVQQDGYVRFKVMSSETES